MLHKKSDYAYNLNRRLFSRPETKGIKSMTRKMAMSTIYQHLNELEASGMITRTRVECLKGRPVRFYYSINERTKRAMRKEKR